MENKEINTTEDIKKVWEAPKLNTLNCKVTLGGTLDGDAEEDEWDPRAPS